MNNSAFSQKIYSFLLSLYRWYLQTPERSLDEAYNAALKIKEIEDNEAYNAALKIKEIEDKHFNGNKIDPDLTMYSSNVMDYFLSDLKKQLKIVRMRLTEFKSSRWFLSEAEQKADLEAGVEYSDPALILEKLRLIDLVITKYTIVDLQTNSLVVVDKLPKIPTNSAINQTAIPKLSNNVQKKPQGKANTTGILPRSILSTINRLQVELDPNSEQDVGTINRLQVELDPNSEQDVVQNFRQNQRRTIISIRFILLLIIVPLLTHQLAKTLLVSPLVENFRGSETGQIFLNFEMEEEALVELERFEEKIKFENLISKAPPLALEETEVLMQEKASEIARKFRQESSNAIKNVFADIFSVIAFIWLLLVSKSSIAILKEFFDNLVYGLSDFSKNFSIILFMV